MHHLEIIASNGDEYEYNNLIEDPAGALDHAAKTGRCAPLRVEEEAGETTIWVNPANVLMWRVWV